MKKIIVFGSINNDLSINVSHMPNKGETLMGDSFLISPGGKGSNQAVAASRLGGDVHMIGRIGDDSFGHQLLLSLKRENVKTTFVKLDPTHSTASAFIIRSLGDNRIIVNPGANQYLPASDLVEFINCHDQIPGSLFVTQLETNKQEVFKAIKAASKAKMLTVLNPSPASNLPADIYQYLDLLIVNQTECKSLTAIYPTSIEESQKAYQLLKAKGLKNLIITLGIKGSEVFSDEETDCIDSYQVKSLDSTGAGDTYLGAVCYGLSNEWSLKKSAAFASAASALKCMKVGAQTGMPTLKETLDFINKKGGKGNE